MNEHHESPEVTPKRKVHRSFLGIGLALLLAAGAFFSGVHMGTLQSNDMQMEARGWSLSLSREWLSIKRSLYPITIP